MLDNPSILIVDDEAPARARLRDLLGDIDRETHLTIAGEARNAREALSLIHDTMPDILLLDVQMPGMSGIDLARQIRARPSACRPELVFVTAHDNFALDAFDLAAADYLLKPVRAHRLREAIRRAASRLPARESDAQPVERPLAPGRRHLSVHERGRVVLVAIDSVIYMKAELKYITVRTAEREYLLEEALSALESEFGDRFVRIHRNALVSREAIAGFERVTPDDRDESGDPFWEVVLRAVPERLPVSRRQWSSLRNLLN